MTALVPLTTRLRMARLALVVPPEWADARAADLAAHGADLLILSKGRRSDDEAAAGIDAARRRLFGLSTLVAADDLDVARACSADVVFLKRPGWRPFGITKPHDFSLLGRSIDGVGEADTIDGDPFSFGFVGPALDGGAVDDRVAQMAAQYPPLALPAAPVWFAAGGIDRGNVASVLDAGARRITVSTSVFGAPDPFEETRALADALAAAWDADPAARSYAEDAFAG